MIQTFMQNSISLPAFPRSPPHGGGGEGWEERGGAGYAGEILHDTFLYTFLYTVQQFKEGSGYLYTFLGTFLDRGGKEFWQTTVPSI